MATLVGVDMAVSADSIVSGGVLTALADADHWLGQQAAFILRYLTPGVNPAAPVATALTVGEVNWIIPGQRRALGLIANGTSASGVAAGWSQGLRDAALHVACAKALGAPAGTALYFDVEDGWLPDPAWIMAVAEAVLQAGFRPGFYGALDSTPFQDPWHVALQRDGGNVGRSLLWSARWTEAQGVSAANVPAWAPSNAGSGPQPCLWQFSDNLGGIADEDALNTTLALAGFWLPPTQPVVVVPTPTGNAPSLAAGLAQAEAGIAAAKRAAGL